MFIVKYTAFIEIQCPCDKEVSKAAHQPKGVMQNNNKLIEGLAYLRFYSVTLVVFMGLNCNIL